MHWERRAFFGVDDVILIWFAHRFYEIYSITSAVAPLVLARTLTGAFNSRRKIQRATAAIVTISERVRFEAHARCVAHRDDGTLGAGPHSGRRRVNSRHGRMSQARPDVVYSRRSRYQKRRECWNRGTQVCWEWEVRWSAPYGCTHKPSKRRRPAACSRGGPQGSIEPNLERGHAACAGAFKTGVIAIHLEKVSDQVAVTRIDCCDVRRMVGRRFLMVGYPVS